MTTLDRAFVRAYQRRGPSAVPMANEPSAADNVETAASAERAARPAASAPCESAPAPETHLVDVFSALQQGPLPASNLRSVASPTLSSGKKDTPASRPSGVRIRVDRAMTPVAPTFEQLASLRPVAVQPPAPPANVAPPPSTVASQAVTLPPLPSESPPLATPPDPEAVAPIKAPPAGEGVALIKTPVAPPAEPDVVEPLAAEPPPAVEMAPDRTADGPASTPAEFQPGLQVDAVLWPEICLRLEQQAGTQLDALADELVGPDRRQHRVVALAGVEAGVGCSTLTLCLARRLTRGGLRVALVDADLLSPTLAVRLGLDVELGWEQPLEGQCPLESVLVESLHDRLTLLPRRQPLELDALTALRMEEHLNRLREHYDVVLLDWGAVNAAAAPDGLTFRRQAARPDLVLLVDDARAASADPCEALAARLETDAVAVVENFVSG